MSIAQSKLTAQGQISVPAEVRKKLGVGPGSVLEWEERDDEIVVRRAGKRTSIEVHAALFPAEQQKPSVTSKEGIRAYIRRKYARS
jgi:antitoxin PrlF